MTEKDIRMVTMAAPYGPVLVTGASGYLAGWVVKYLLDAGVTVHACVRDPGDEAKVAHLLQMEKDAPGSLRLFRADLLEPGSHEAAMQECRIVMHTASPFLLPSRIKDPRRDVLEPALKGTRDVLETACGVPSVERVVLTSSTVAIIDTVTVTGKLCTEADWNEVTTLETTAYPYSKVLAEREAWKIADAQQRWKLVVINPAFIVGPGTAPQQTSATFDQFRALSDGTFAKNMPVRDVGVVDVRDVAEAHLRGAYVEGANGRNIVFAEVLSMSDMATILKEAFGDDPRWHFPPDTPWNPDVPHWRADNSKSRRELGMTYRPVQQAIIDTFRQFAGI